MKTAKGNTLGKVPSTVELAKMPVEQRLAHLPVEPPDTPLSAGDLVWVETDVDWEQDEP